MLEFLFALGYQYCQGLVSEADASMKNVKVASVALDRSSNFSRTSGDTSCCVEKTEVLI